MIRILDLDKSFGPKKVLEGVDLDIRTGETMVVIGQSGSGKSVLLKLLIGILKPDAGKIFIDGIERHGPARGRTAESDAQVRDAFSGRGAVRLDDRRQERGLRPGAVLRPVRAEISEGQVAESLEKVGLSGIERLMPYELSGGMKKRVGLARAIAYQPEIMLYDEPSTGIDPIRADAINELIILLKKEMSVTSVVITHDMVSAYKVADRIAMLYEGTNHRGRDVPTRSGIRRTHIVQQFIHGRADGPIRNW